MLKTATKLENSRVELEIEVGAEAFEAAVAKAYKKNISKLNVPGFRKGKAPRHLVEKLYGEGVFYDEAMNDIYPEALDEAIKEFEGKGYGEFKLAVGETCADALAPVREEFARLMADKAYLEEVMKEGASNAYRHARKTMSKVRRKIGFTELKM